MSKAPKIFNLFIEDPKTDNEKKIEGKVIISFTGPKASSTGELSGFSDGKTIKVGPTDPTGNSDLNIIVEEVILILINQVQSQYNVDLTGRLKSFGPVSEEEELVITPTTNTSKIQKIIFVGGLDNRTGDLNIEEQSKLVIEAYGDNVTSFRYNASTTQIEKEIENNIGSPIILFSAGCTKSKEIANILITLEQKLDLLHIVEPYTCSDDTKSIVESAIKLGVPSSNVFKGSSDCTGANITGATSNKELGKSDYKNPTHWDAIKIVSKFIKSKFTELIVKEEEVEKKKITYEVTLKIDENGKITNDKLGNLKIIEKIVEPIGFDFGDEEQDLSLLDDEFIEEDFEGSDEHVNFLLESELGESDGEESGTGLDDTSTKLNSQNGGGSGDRRYQKSMVVNGVKILNGELPADLLTKLDFINRKIEKNAAIKLNKLNIEFKKEFGKDLPISDGYRLFETQNKIFDWNYFDTGLNPITGNIDVKEKGRKIGSFTQKNPVGTAAAKPGTSLHGWGQAIDISDFGNGPGNKFFDWMEKNAGKYNWINPAWAKIPGAGYEPWHWEYNGPDLFKSESIA